MLVSQLMNKKSNIPHTTKSSTLSQQNVHEHNTLYNKISNYVQKKWYVQPKWIKHHKITPYSLFSMLYLPIGNIDKETDFIC